MRPCPDLALQDFPASRGGDDFSADRIVCIRCLIDARIARAFGRRHETRGHGIAQAIALPVWRLARVPRTARAGASGVARRCICPIWR